VYVVRARRRADLRAIRVGHALFARAFHTCGSRRRRVVRASGSCVIRVFSRVVHALSRRLRASRVPFTRVTRLVARR
jgi:hypothetical protein